MIKGGEGREGGSIRGCILTIRRGGRGRRGKSPGVFASHLSLMPLFFLTLGWDKVR